MPMGNEQARALAGRCREGYACLSGSEKHPQCPLDKRLGSGAVLFLEAKSLPPCSYHMSFGRSYICLCPVRQQMHQESEK
jgi:hypothetical protein